MSFFCFFCHIMKNIHQDDVDDNKVIKKMLICEPEAWVQAGKVKVDKTVGNIATLR